jgi:hypothetical protein
MAKTRKKPEYYPEIQYSEWIDDIGPELLKTPKEFDFSKCLNFLARSPLEPCHKVQNNTLYKLEKFDGQMVQINLRFAYTLKKRFVEAFGEKFSFCEQPYYLFPTPRDISRLWACSINRPNK